MVPDYNISNLNILVVEGHDQIRQMIVDVLHELGVRDVRDASSVEDAFDLFQKFAADMVLLDWSPGLNGLEFLARVRSHVDSRDTFAPVVMLTAFSELPQVCEARDAGMNELLVKPMTATAIYHRIRTLIEQPKLYVRTDGYFGPDRRRRHRGPYSSRDRRDGLHPMPSPRRSAFRPA